MLNDLKQLLYDSTGFVEKVKEGYESEQKNDAIKLLEESSIEFNRHLKNNEFNREEILMWFYIISKLMLEPDVSIFAVILVQNIFKELF